MNADRRIQWLHKRIAEGRYPNAGHLAERFGISHRQAQRDVDYLRTHYGAPLAYHAKHRGFYYKKPFSLPVYTVSANERDYVDAMTGDAPVAAEREILQMQLPYTATVHIPDKLTRFELRRFIVRELPTGDCVCEFHSVELFLGVLLTTPADLTVKEPAWLRERLLACAERALKNNREAPEDGKKAKE